MKYACERCRKALDSYFDKDKTVVIETRFEGISDKFVLCEECYCDFIKYV